MKIELTYQGLRALTDTRGGELISLQNAVGTEYIWDGNPAFWPGINPLLFPFVGTLKDGTVCFEGKPYSMERHGFARRMDFSVAEQRENSILFELRETEQTLAQYPYPFLLKVRHTLEENGFITRQPSAADKRVLELSPTEKALNLLPELRDTLRTWRLRVTADLTEEEQAQLSALLAKMKIRAAEYMEER